MLVYKNREGINVYTCCVMLYFDHKRENQISEDSSVPSAFVELKGVDGGFVLHEIDGVQLTNTIQCHKVPSLKN